MAFYREDPKWDQNPKFTPLSESTSIPAPFIWESPPPPPPPGGQQTITAGGNEDDRRTFVAAWPPVFTAIAMPIDINNDFSTIEKTIGYLIRTNVTYAYKYIRVCAYVSTSTRITRVLLVYFGSLISELHCTTFPRSGQGLSGHTSRDLNRPFPSSPSFSFKTTVSATPLIWKIFLILMQIKLIFIRKVEDLASISLLDHHTIAQR